MSHFAVAIFAKSYLHYDSLMEPYDENNTDEFDDIPTYKNTSWWREQYEKSKSNLLFEEWLDANGYHYSKAVDTVYGTGNPHGYYDYYTLDARTDDFPMKKGAMRDEHGEYHASDLDLTLKSDKDGRLARFWEVVIENQPLREGEDEIDFRTFYNPDYLRKRYVSKENYVFEHCDITPYAFVDSNGEWHAPGIVGWWAVSDDTAETYAEYSKAFHRYVEEHPDEYVTIADCHI